MTSQLAATRRKRSSVRRREAAIKRGESVMQRRASALRHWWVNLRIRYKGLLVIALPIVGIVATILLRIPLAERQQTTQALLSRWADTRDTTHELLLALLDAETGALGFSLTRDRAFHRPFEQAGRTLPQALDALAARVSEAEERRLADELATHARRRLQLASEIVALAESGAPPTDRRVQERLAQGKMEMDLCRALVKTLVDIQHARVEQSRAELERIRQRLAPILWVAFFGGFIGAAAAMWLFATGVAERLGALERSAERLAQGVRLHYERSRGRDEIGKVDRALRRASVTIRKRNRELRILNETLERTVYDQELLNRELEAFSYSVSHDLRAPLRSIDGFAQALREDWGDRLDEAGQDNLARVRNAAQRMGRLIDDLLKLSRLTRTPVQRIDVDLTRLAEDVIADLSERNPARDVIWDVAGALRANCDPSLARIVLENLLGNAWKFTSKTAGARIEFFAMADTQPTMFVVRDNGAGFDMKYADKLFAPFQRLHGEREFPGTGIGLATVQRIVHKHGGQVRTRAEVGQGATFYFTLEPADGVVAA